MAVLNQKQFGLSFEQEVIDKNPGIITHGEFFAGGGGWTHGMNKVKGVKTKWILNHDEDAIMTNAFHHPGVTVYFADFFKQNEKELERVDYVHASVECQEHSVANGGKKKKIGSYMMGWELIRFIKYLKPILLTIENVAEFKKWGPLDENGDPIKERIGEEFESWKQTIKDLGYEYTESIRNAADDGLPTRRKRYFGAFYKPGMDFKFPESTHSKGGEGGKKKWKSCKKHIDLQDEGVSIFGRKFNEKLPKHLRRELADNSLKRIANGVLKHSTDFKQFISMYFNSNGNPGYNTSSLRDPLPSITKELKHQLVTIEKMKFIADHCQVDLYQKINAPLNTQTCRQTKQLVSVDHVMVQYYGSMNYQTLEGPIKTIPTKDRHQLLRIEKAQFIVKYIGKPNSSSSLNDPIKTIETSPNKHQLITLIDNFDIKARFLRADELAACSTFPRDYFNRPGLKVSGKKAIKMIGNAIPPDWAGVIMGPNVKRLREFKRDSLYGKS